MLEVICKKSYFSRQIVKLTVKVCLVLRAGQIGTRNKDLRPLRTRFDTTNLIIVSKLKNELLLKITFFEVSTIVSIYVKF